MADIILNIQGQATEASSAVDTLVGKLEQLSSTLERIAKLSKTAFSNMGANIDTGKFDTLSQRLDDILDKMNQMSGKSGNASVEIKETTKQVSSLGTAAGKSGGFLDKMGKSIGRIAFYRLLRTAIKAVGQAFKEGLQNAYAFSKLHGGPLANAMDKITKSSTIMKNQLGAAFGGLITAIAPVITFLTNLLTRFAAFLTQIFALLGGQNTYKVATDGFSDIEQAAGGAGGAVKGLLAPWDELNVIGQESGGGGGASALDAAAGMFEYAEIPDWLKNLWEESGLEQNIEWLKEQFKWFKEQFENGDFKETINVFFLDPLRTVIDTATDVLLILNGLLSGDLLVVGTGAASLIWNSLFNTVILPFTRTIDAIFGTDLTSKVLEFKETVNKEMKDFVKSDTKTSISNGFKSAFTSAVSKIKTTLKPLADWIGNLFKGVWQIIRASWLVLWQTTLKTPLLNFLKWLINKLEPVAVAIAKVWDKIKYFIQLGVNQMKKWFGTLYNFIIDKVVNPIIKYLNKIGPKAAKILGETWTDIEEAAPIATETFNTIITESNDTAKAVKKSFDGMRSFINRELSANPEISFKYKNTKVRVEFKVPGGSTHQLGNLALTTASMYASGGFPTTGQLFVANEAGPEMVGRIGNRTAVANNDQIVSSVASGVAEANATGNALLSQLVSVGQQLLNKDLTITPSIALGQVVQRSQSMYARS